MSKVRCASDEVTGFFNKLISTYLHSNRYLGSLDCELQFITNQAYASLKRAKFRVPKIHNANSAAIINVDASKWLENHFAGCGVLLRGVNRMPRVFQISRHSCVDELEAEANANLEGFKIGEQNGYVWVVVYTDAGHITDFVKDKKQIWQNQEHVKEYIERCKELLQKNSSWSHVFIHRGLNAPADSLAMLASYLIKNGWPGEMNKVYMNKHGLKVVIRISKDNIYMENCVPLGFKQVLIDEDGRWPLSLELYPKVVDEKLVVATAKESFAMFSLCLNELNCLIYVERNTKTVWIEFWKGCVLVGEIRVGVHYGKELEKQDGNGKKLEKQDLLSDVRFNQLLFNLEAFRKLPLLIWPTPEELTLRLVVQLYNYSDEEWSELRPKAKVELPASCLEVGRCGFSDYGGDGEFDVSVIGSCNWVTEWVKHEEFKEDLEKIDEIDLGNWLKKDRDHGMAITMVLELVLNKVHVCQIANDDEKRQGTCTCRCACGVDIRGYKQQVKKRRWKTISIVSWSRDG